uniref:Uncharacterized protein n=1 Tax=Nelumbo nucifera TaxID=4432 RepID=A0A822XFN3_NELNU|nr:TPA_asm: hypothetical protein HUJ06_019936 [Nelumbo nucifera]
MTSPLGPLSGTGIGRPDRGGSPTSFLYWDVGGVPSFLGAGPLQVNGPRHLTLVAMMGILLAEGIRHLVLVLVQANRLLVQVHYWRRDMTNDLLLWLLWWLRHLQSEHGNLPYLNVLHCGILDRLILLPNRSAFNLDVVGDIDIVVAC